GTGEVDLGQLPQIPYPQDTVANLKVKIHSYTENIEAVATSIYSQDSVRVDVPNAEISLAGLDYKLPVDSEGKFRTDIMSTKSAVILSATAPQHVGTMQLGMAGKLLHLILYPEKWIASLLSMINGTTLSDF